MIRFDYPGRSGERQPTIAWGAGGQSGPWEPTSSAAGAKAERFVLRAAVIHEL